MQRSILFITFLFCFVFVAKAQKPDTVLKKDSIPIAKSRQDSIKAAKTFAPKIKKEKIYHPDSTHSPTTAWHRSAFVPGLGQVYNRKWWKVPIIYAGLGLIASAYVFNQKYYDQNLTIARYRQRGITPAPTDKYYNEFKLYELYNYPDQSITDAVKGYARYRDISVLGFVAFWGVQIIDAYIDAKFIHSYSMDDNYSFKVAPTLLNQPMYAANFNGSYIPGLKITFTLR